jgi:hypothetical protein
MPIVVRPHGFRTSLITDAEGVRVDEIVGALQVLSLYAR